MNVQQILSLTVPHRVIDEIIQLLKWWARFYIEKKVNFGDIFERMLLPEAVERADRVDRITRQVFYFITYHELAHWLMSVMPPHEHQAYINKMSAYLLSWVEEDVMVDQEQKTQLAEKLCKGDPVFNSWVEEMHADATAIEACWTLFGTFFNERSQAKVAQQVYASQALTYSLIVNLTELFQERILGKPVSLETHPPAFLRTSIFCYVGGRVRGKSQLEFANNDWGVGMIIYLIMQRVIAVLLQEQNDAD